MRLHLLRRKDTGASEQGEIRGRVRVDKRTKNLVRRLRPGDLAVIDHRDLDRVAAEALIHAEVGGVLNAAQSISGRYPNMGPRLLMDAGVVLVDQLGPEIMALREGQEARVVGADVLVGNSKVASGVRQTEQTVADAMVKARAGLSEQMEAFAANTMSFLREEYSLLLDGVGVPKLRTSLQDRQVLIVVRGERHKEDLAALRPYIREYHPVLIGVDGGADALLEIGLKPQIIVGDMDSVSDDALGCGAEIVVHAYRDGTAPGLARVESLGVPHVVFPAAGTSEDVAMMLADDLGARLIVAVGTHATLVEFLDKGRMGMASSFLTRLRVGGKLVDAKGVSRLYRQRISTLQLVLLALAGLLALLVALFATSGGQAFLGIVGVRVEDLWTWLAGLFGGGV